MTLNAVIDYNSYIGSETYTIFADAYKCFDELNLNDCISDISKMVGASEAIEILNMNKHGEVKLKTPIGDIGPVKANEIVRQGTIMGPTLCCVNTDQINKVGVTSINTIGPRIKLQALAYVDDIQNSSSTLDGLTKVGKKSTNNGRN